MLQDENLVTFSEAAKRLPRLNKRKLHASTIWRWATKGIQGVKLEVLKLGGRYVTSIEAIERFGKQLADVGVAQHAGRNPSKHKPSQASLKPPAANARQKQIDRAAQELAKAGI